MDAFEAVIALLLRAQGYWTCTSFKVELTKAEKRAIGRHSVPRWEIDIVAYKGATNELLAVECKSYLDSPGVTFDGTALVPASRYKLFTEKRTRDVVLSRMASQLAASGACAANPKVGLALAAGKLRHPKREADLAAYFATNGWQLYGPGRIAELLHQCVDARYENDVAFVTAKILGRNAASSVRTKGRVSGRTASGA